MKTHFAVKVAFSTEFASSCGRGKRMDTNVYDVTCGLCKQRSAFILAKDEADSARHKRFMESIPTRVREPWREGNIECRGCGSDLFRHGDRTCYGHYDNFVCANCGNVESRLTEIGMSF